MDGIYATKTNNPMSEPLYFASFRALLQRGELQQVFEQLPAQLPLDSPPTKELLILESRHLRLRHEEKHGLIAPADAAQERNRITQALLELLSFVERRLHLRSDDAPRAAGHTCQDHIRDIRNQLNDHDQLAHAFSRLQALLERECPELLPDLSPLRASFNAHRNDYIVVSTIDRDTYMRAMNQAIKGVGELLQAVQQREAKVRGQGVQLGSDLSIHNCDRKKIIRHFLRTFEQQEEAEAPAHIYLLHHQKYGQSKSLVRRLITKLKNEYPAVKYPGFRNIPIKKVELMPGDEMDEYEFSFRKGFSQGLQPQVRSLEKLLERVDAQYPQFGTARYLPFVLHVHLPAADWAQAGRDGLCRFLEDFCGVSQRHARIPVIFLIVEFKQAGPKTAPKKNLFGLFGKKPTPAQPDWSPPDELKQVAQRLRTPCVFLPPLKLVVEADLSDWYSAYEPNERRREQKVAELIRQLGPSPQGGWHMADVEHELKRIVENHKNAAYNL